MQGADGQPKKIKVLYMITKGVWGGAAEYVYTLARSLPRETYDVAVLCGEGKALPDRLEKAGIRVYSLPTLMRDISVTQEIKNFFALVKIIRLLKPDVLHLNSPKAGGLVALAGRLAFVPHIIYTAHGWTFNEKRNSVAKGVIFFVSWLTVKLAHKTIVIAEREKKQALAMPFVNPRKIILIQNGIGAFETYTKTESREKLVKKMDVSIAHKTLWLGTIAELHRNKGLEYAIEALAHLTVPFVYFIFGEGEERKKLEALIVQHNLQKKVFLLGFVPDVQKFLSAFDIFLLPSVKEGLPYAVLEAGLAGLPVVASKVGGIPDIIDNGETGILVTPARPGEITRAVEYLIQNPDTRKTYGKHLKEKVHKNFSVEEMVKKTVELYKV